MEVWVDRLPAILLLLFPVIVFIGIKWIHKKSKNEVKTLVNTALDKKHKTHHLNENGVLEKRFSEDWLIGDRLMSPTGDYWYIAMINPQRTQILINNAYGSERLIFASEFYRNCSILERKELLAIQQEKLKLSRFKEENADYSQQLADYQRELKLLNDKYKLE